MSYAITMKSLTRYRVSIFFILFFTGLGALLPLSTQAQCIAGWDASGEWEFNQAGQKKRIKLNLTQKGQKLAGTALHPLAKITPGKGWDFAAAEDLSGTVDGYTTGNSITLNIAWDNATTGVYIGEILPSGKVKGKGHEKRSPSVQVSWDNVGTLKCLPPLIYKPSQTPPPPKILKSGRKRKTEPPPMKVPSIVASQPFFPQYSQAGLVTLTWDAGADHPYAEVWFKVNNGPETRLVEQGKGSRQLPVNRGTHYTYILTDSGKVLSTVTFVAN